MQGFLSRKYAVRSRTKNNESFTFMNLRVQRNSGGAARRDTLAPTASSLLAQNYENRLGK